MYSVLISGIVYPVVAHWVWSSDGWLYKMGMIDFAGSGVVHCTGGVVALCGAITIGPRLNRFVLNADGTRGDPLPMPANSVTMQALGVFILWFGWYGFNSGSTLQVSDGTIYLAARVATTTTLSAAAAVCLSVPFGKMVLGHFDLGLALNCALAGLVSITAGCAVVSPGAAVAIGSIGALIYMGVSTFILSLHIDDPLDAFPIHGACDAWAVLAVGLFDPAATPEQFGVQLLGITSIVAWASLWALCIFNVCARTCGLRVTAEVELAGIDVFEHGGAAICTEITFSLDDILQRPALRRTMREFMARLYSEESLDFLIECRELFVLLDLDVRGEFLLEDRQVLSSQVACPVGYWPRVVRLVNTFVRVGSDKEINIDSTLSTHILSLVDSPAPATVNASFEMSKGSFLVDSPLPTTVNASGSDKSFSINSKLHSSQKVRQTEFSRKVTESVKKFMSRAEATKISSEYRSPESSPKARAGFDDVEAFPVREDTLSTHYRYHRPPQRRIWTVPPDRLPTLFQRKQLSLVKWSLRLLMLILKFAILYLTTFMANSAKALSIEK